MARRKKAVRHDLSPLELDVMNVIWQLGECTSAQVIEEFQKTRDLANTTIRTVMSNIRRKGYIEMVPSVESRIHFRPRVSREQVARRTLKEMVGKLFAGSPREAIAFLLEDETLDPGELDEIRKMIDAYDDAEEDTR